jgi:hypothetical protein
MICQGYLSSVHLKCLLTSNLKIGNNEDMPKTATHETLRHHHNLLLLCILALFVILGILAFKYLTVKKEWRGHAVQLQGGIQKYQDLESIEEANIIGTTVTSFPPVIPLIKIPGQLQSYIESIGEKTGRDIVVVDKNKKIIADTNPAEVGQTYNFDTSGEIAKTMFDGTPRSFIEKSTAYPDGIILEIVQLKDSKGTIIGAILISPSNVFSK